MRRSRMVSIALAAVLLSTLATPGPSFTYAVSNWGTTPLTAEAGYHRSLQVSADRVVWLGYDGANWQVCTRKLGLDASPVQLTSDANDHYAPQVSGDRVVWTGYDGTNHQIFTQEIGVDASPVQLTADANEHSSPQVSGDRVVWLGYVGTHQQVFTQKLGVDVSPVQLTDAIDDLTPQVDQDRVVWSGFSIANYQIYTQDMGVDAFPVRLTNDANDHFGPQVSGDRIVWQLFQTGSLTNHPQVFTQKLGVDASPVALTSSAQDNFWPEVSGDRVAWKCSEGGSFTQKIGVDGSPVVLPGYPSISGDRLAWVSADGGHVYTQKMGVDASPTELANSPQGISAVALSGDRVVWDTSVWDWSVPANNLVGRISVASPLVGTTLALSSGSVLSLAYGSSFTIRGTLRSAGVGLPGKRVILQSCTPGATLKDTSLTATTTAGGAFSFTTRPATKTFYGVRFAGSAEYAASGPTSPVYAVPRVYVGTPVAPSKMYRTKYYTVYGYLKPRHTAGTYPVRIYAYRYVSGKWRTFGFAAARASNYSTYTKYSRSIRLPYAGKWKVRAWAPADGLHAATWSTGWDYVTVQ